MESIKNFIRQKFITSEIYPNKNIIIGISLFPAFYILTLILDLQRLPNNDYWFSIIGVLMAIDSNSGLSVFLSSLFIKSNEHIIAVPLLLHVVNWFITNGSNLGLFLIAFSAKIIQFYFIYKMIIFGKLKSSRPPFWLLPFLSLFIFTPAAAHNWILSFSGSVWFLANTFIIIGIYYLFKISEKKYWRYLTLSGLAILLGTLSYSTAMFVFPAITVYLFLSRSGVKRWAPYLIFGIGYYSLWLIFYKTPAHHPEVQKNILDILKFVFAFLGGIFTKSVGVAQIYGLVGLFISFVLLILIFKNTQNKELDNYGPWIIMGFYSVINALGSALARSGFGVGTALSSRYASLPGLFWIGLTVILFIYLQKSNISWVNKKRINIFIASAMVIILIIPMYIAGNKTITELQTKYEVQEVAELSLSLGIVDDYILTKTITPAPGIFTEKNLSILRSYKHVPFDESLLESFTYGEKIASEDVTEASLKGNFDQANLLEEGIFRVNGWAFSSSVPIEYVIVTNRRNKLRGIALMGTERPDVVSALQEEEAKNSGWIGYAKLSKGDKGLIAYAKIKDKDEYIPLNGVLERKNISNKSEEGGALN